MIPVIEYLEWDSREFGMKVGRLELKSPSLLTDRLADTLRKSDYRLIYINSPEPLDDSRMAHGSPGLFYDIREEYIKELLPVSPIAGGEPKTVSARGLFPPEALIPLGIQAGVFSRFNLDPAFPDAAFRHLYTLWVEKAIYNGPDSDILTVVADGRPHAILTYTIMGDTAEIGLLSVDAPCRGRGYAAALLRDFEHRARQAGAKLLKVATQGANLPAAACYRHAGYTLAKRSYTYHYWH